MVKRMANSTNKCLRIIITGPESTGKSLLAKELAARFNAPVIAEYAREYITNLDRHYNYDDIIAIALEQVNQMNRLYESSENIAFFDTYLVITKIWLQVAYSMVPKWIDTEIQKTQDAVYLLCKPDIPWEPDPLRENGGEMRNILFEKYEKELKQQKLNYYYIEGVGGKRLECAYNCIKNRILKDGNQ